MKRKPVSKKSLRYIAATRKKGEMLGIDFSKAYRILCRKIIKAYFVLRDDGLCFRCGLPIGEADEFHIDHKESWMLSLNPTASYFDLRNLALSHPICNSLARNIRHASSEKMKEVGHKTRGSDGRFKKDKKS